MVEEVPVYVVAKIRIIVVPISQSSNGDSIYPVVKAQVYDMKSMVAEFSGPKPQAVHEAVRFVTSNYVCLPQEWVKEYERKNA